MTERLLVSTAPIFKVKGETNGDLARDLIRLEVEETTQGLKTLMMRLTAEAPNTGEKSEDLLYVDGSLDFGMKLEVSIGTTDQARTIFTGLISAIEICYREGEPPEVVVFAEDKLMELRMTRHSKTYKNKSDADIASDIASLHGLQPDVSADGPTYKELQQWNTSDLAFLRERGSLIQAEVWVDDTKLCFKTRPNRGGTSITLVRGNQLMEVQARADLAHQRTKVKVSGYDAGTRDRIEEEAGDDAISAEVSGAKSGVSVLQQAFGDRVSYHVREAPIQGAEATAWAKAEMLRRARSFVTVAGLTNGTSDMVVGSQLTLQHVGHPFEGPAYYATRVCHTYDAIDGFRTRFSAERPTLQEGS